MTRFVARSLAAAALLSAGAMPQVLIAQAAGAAASADTGARRPEDKPPKLFASHEPIQFTVTGDLREIIRDKNEDPPWRPAEIVYVEDGDSIRLPVRARTRGIFRLRHCSFPPLRLNFVKDSVKGTLFAKQDKPKLGTHCRERDDYEQIVVQEYLLYRIYALLTPMSFRARLARVSYEDRSGDPKPTTRWAVLIEDPDALMERLGQRLIETKGVMQEALDHDATVVLGLFQYMIGNTDWSVPGLHNIEIVERSPYFVFAVPYDFDWSGAISARYAEPDPRLGTRHVAQRLWRTVCPTERALASAIALFNAKRPEIEALYRDFAPLDERHARRTLRYYEEFYRTINDGRMMQRELEPVCRGE